MVINVNMLQTVGLGVVVFLIGELIVKRVYFLQKYCIPAPVIGGTIFALMHLLGVSTGMFSFKFDQTLKDFFMIGFFTIIGFSASIKIIKKGGVAIAIMFIASCVMVIIQNVWGVAMARAFDLHPLIGICAGSISLVGGLGSSAAYAPVMEANGAVGGLTVAITSATFGIFLSGLIGGPIAKYIIDKKGLLQKAEEADRLGLADQTDYSKLDIIEDDEPETIKTADLSKGFFILMIAMGVGSVISTLISATGIVFPTYVCCMLVAALIRNIADNQKIILPEKELVAVGNIFLSIFLAMAIMALEIWKIAGMALPLLVILIGQLILLILYVVFIVYNAAGRDYDSALIGAGFFGYAMGATPNAMASMNAVSIHYNRPSEKAFFTIPISGFLIDIVMPILVTTHMNLIIAGIV